MSNNPDNIEKEDRGAESSSSSVYHQNTTDARSTTPLDFDFTTPWVDQDFQDLAIQALNAATAADEGGVVADRSNFFGTTSSTSNVASTGVNDTIEATDDDVLDLVDDEKKPAASELSEVLQPEHQLEEKPSKKRDYEAHTITGAIAPAPTVSRRKKKPKGMPKRPLSAYNIFFQKERVHVLAEAAALGGVRSSPASGATASKISNNSNSTAVSFEDLGKIIGRRWKALPHSERKQYEDLAQDDAERYKSEMDVFQEAKRLRNERQLTYQPEELRSNNKYHGGRFSRLSRPPEIKSLPFNIPLRARFPGQQQPLVVAPVETGPFNHPPDWARQRPEPPPPPASAATATAAGASVRSSINDSDHGFPIPSGTELLLPDPSLGGRERRFRVEYKFYSMTRKDAETYMESLASFSSRMMPPAQQHAQPQQHTPSRQHTTQQQQQQQQQQSSPRQLQQQQQQQQPPPSHSDKGFPHHQHYWH